MNDKDNAVNLVAGILIAGEIQRRNDEVVREQEHQNRKLNEEKDGLQRQKESVESKNKHLASYNDDLEYDVQVLQLKNIRLEDEVRKLKNTNETQAEALADWMVSQKAFKELAIQLGKKEGIKAEEIIKMGLDKEIDVLENIHDPNHKTNVGNSALIGPYVEKLKKKILDKKPA